MLVVDSYHWLRIFYITQRIRRLLTDLCKYSYLASKSQTTPLLYLKISYITLPNTPPSTSPPPKSICYNSTLCQFTQRAKFSPSCVPWPISTTVGCSYSHQLGPALNDTLSNKQCDWCCLNHPIPPRGRFLQLTSAPRVGCQPLPAIGFGSFCFPATVHF